MARQLTAVAGASDVFWGGVVSYSCGAKQSWLGVSAATLGDYGAVSGEVACAMAEGVLRAGPVGLAVATTGVAGPGGGTPATPVGTVWFGLGAVRNGLVRVAAVRHTFKGTRAQVQSQASRWGRVLSRRWWEGQMELDSLRSLTDNDHKPFIEASQTPLPFDSNPL